MKVKQVKNSIGPSIRRKRRALERVPRQAYDFFVQKTPIDKGNARRKTKFSESSGISTIDADYPYAVPLNKGHSKQAPKGMTEPTIKYIKRLINRIAGMA